MTIFYQMLRILNISKLEKSSNSLSLVYNLAFSKRSMQLIEMVVWFCFGFAPTLGVGNLVWSRRDKRNKETIPWEI